MLVLSRKLGEQIQIDSDITVTVVSIDGNRVRLGFDAPVHVPILRKELAKYMDRHECETVAGFQTDSGNLQTSAKPGQPPLTMSRDQ
jgi:carbon storage regulator